MQNEPNFSIADWGQPWGLPPRPCAGKSCKTNPIAGGRDAPSFQYSTIPAFQSDVDCAKQTQFDQSHTKGKFFAGKWL
jgi:hypothetical protein